MIKKKILLFGALMICLVVTGCGTRNISTAETNVLQEKETAQVSNGDKNDGSVGNIVNSTDSDDNVKNDEGKLMLSRGDMLRYNGYMDAVDENWFGTKYVLSDYDNDGIPDRVYREAIYTDPNKESEGLVPDRVKFRIDFGNGDKLELGTFDDAFLGIKIIGADLTGDGNNEIIFLGHHDALTDAESYSEIAVFQKNNLNYERIKLPKADDEALNSDYLVGYPVYAKNDTGSEITLYADYASYEETIHISRTDYNRNERYLDKDIICCVAWGIGTEKVEGKVGLVLYQRIGGRNYYENNLKITLVWQEDEFKPVKMKTTDKHYEW